MSPLLKRVSSTTFAALEVPNYRLYISGQAVSLTGTWMQMAAQSWLVLKLTALGHRARPDRRAADPAGSAPRSLWRRHRRPRQQAQDDDRAAGDDGYSGADPRTADGHELGHVWEIGVLAFILGLNNAFENPARQSFMLELVGPEHLRNAVSLNSTMVNVARVVGPGSRRCC